LNEVWFPVYDLLNSGPDKANFVVEMTDDRLARLRFGQRGFGRRPDLDTDPKQAELWADYRVGNGGLGNVAANSIRAFGSYGDSYPELQAVRNPLPASGGTDPQPTQEIRLFAPHAIRSNIQRALTPEDYEQIAFREFGTQMQRAKATFLWTGHEVLLAVDPKSSVANVKTLLGQIQHTLHTYRRIGHSVHVRQAAQVIPELTLSVCLGAKVLREQIRNELNVLFSNQVLPNGQLAFFHPDRLTFGEGLFVSQIVAAAKQQLGERLVHLEVTTLERRAVGPATELEDGVLWLAPQEILRFDNDPQHPEYGILTVDIKGGR
jgi:predicted phage baseplate assembly protein